MKSFQKDVSIEDTANMFEGIEVKHTVSKEGTQVLSFIIDPDVNKEKVLINVISEVLKLRYKDETKDFGTMFLSSSSEGITSLLLGDENKLAALIATALVTKDEKLSSLSRILTKAYLIVTQMQLNNNLN